MRLFVKVEKDRRKGWCAERLTSIKGKKLVAMCDKIVDGKQKEIVIEQKE